MSSLYFCVTGSSSPQSKLISPTVLIVTLATRQMILSDKVRQSLTNSDKVRQTQTKSDKLRQSDISQTKSDKLRQIQTT